jgi:hypothetical protein
MLFSYGYGQQQQQIGDSKNAGKSLAISIAIRMRRYDAGHIAQYNTSKASLGATGCRHRASACAVLPRRPSWSTNSLKQH